MYKYNSFYRHRKHDNRHKKHWFLLPFSYGYTAMCATSISMATVAEATVKSSYLPMANYTYGQNKWARKNVTQRN